MNPNAEILSSTKLNPTFHIPWPASPASFSLVDFSTEPYPNEETSGVSSVNPLLIFGGHMLDNTNIPNSSDMFNVLYVWLLAS